MDPATLTDPQLVARYLELAWPVITNVGLALLTVAVGWLASKWADRVASRMLRRAHVHEGLARFLGTVARLAVFALAMVSALGRLGIATASLLTVLASAGLAVGLALKGTIGDFASGIVLVVFRPFQIDDIVDIAGISGTVTDVGLWATALNTFDGGVAVLPNSLITADKIVNYSRRGVRRVTVRVGVAYGADLDAVRVALRAAIDAVATKVEDPPPDVRFGGFGASSVDFDVLVWTSTPDFVTTTQQLSSAIYLALQAADIEIPFSQVVVHHQGDVPTAAAAK